MDFPRVRSEFEKRWHDMSDLDDEKVELFANETLIGQRILFAIAVEEFLKEIEKEVRLFLRLKRGDAD